MDDKPQGLSLARRLSDRTKPLTFRSSFESDATGTPFLKRMIPFVGDAANIEAIRKLHEAAEAYNEGTHSPEQLVALQSYTDQLNRQSSGIGEKVGGVMAGSLEFIPSIMTGGAAAKGAAKAGGKLVGQAALKKAAAALSKAGVAGRVGANITKGAAAVAANDLIGGVVGEGGPTLSQAHDRFIAERLQLSSEDNQLMARIVEDSPEVEDFIAKSFVTNTIQYAGEYAGSMVFKLPPKGRAAALSYMLTDKLAKKEGAPFARKVLEATGTQGVIEELGEEVYSATLNDLTAALTRGNLADPGQLEELADLENAAALVIGVVGTGAGMQFGAGLAGRAVDATVGRMADKALLEDAEGALAAGAPESPSEPPSAPSTQTLTQAPNVAPRAAQEAEVSQDEPGGLDDFSDLADDVPFEGFEEPGPGSPNDPGGPLGSTASAREGDTYNRDQTAPAPKTQVRFEDIIPAMESAAQVLRKGFVVRWNRLHPGSKKGWAGSYSPADGTARFQAGDIDTAAHEIGHELEMGFSGGKGFDWKKAGVVPADVLTELRDIGYQEAKAQGYLDNAQAYGKESFAEFWRRWFAGDPSLDAKATEAWVFETLLADNPKAVKALQKAREIGDTWRRSMRPLDRVIQKTTKEPALRRLIKKFATKEGIQRVKEKLVVDWLEELAPLKRFQTDAQAAIDIAVKNGTLDVNNVYDLASALRGSEGAELAAMVRAPFTLEDGSVHQGLWLGKEVEGRLEEFNGYLTARHIQTLHQPDVVAKHGERKTPVSLADADAIVKFLDADFREAAERLYDWRDAALRKIGEKEQLLGENIDNLLKAGYRTYVPFKKDTRDWVGQVGGVASSANKAEVSKRLKGSFRSITPPLQTLMADMQANILKGNERQVMDFIIKTMEVARKNPEAGPIGGWIEEVPVDRALAANPTVSQAVAGILKAVGAKNDQALREQVVALMAEGRNEQLAEVLKSNGHSEEVTSEEVTELLDEHVPFFTVSWNPKKGEDAIIPWKTPNGLRYYSVNRDIYDTLYGLRGDNLLPKWAEKIFGVPKKIMTLGTTGLNAEFAAITNTTRDALSLPFNISTSPWIIPMWFKSARIALDNVVDAMKIHGGNARYEDLSEWHKTFTHLHLDGNQFFDVELRGQNQAIRQVVGGKRVVPANAFQKVARKLFEGYKDVLSATEKSNRLVAVHYKAQELGVDLNKPETWTKQQWVTLKLEAQHAGTDFVAGGAKAKAVNRVQPFFNPAIQGPRVTIRRTLESRTMFRRNMLIGAQLMTIPTLLLWWANKDEEWYQALSDEEKARFWYVPVGTELMAIAKPFEIAAFGASPAEFLADAMYREDPQTASEYFSALLEGVKPSAGNLATSLTPPVPLTVPGRLVLEQALNKSLYWGTPIVGRANLNKREWDQYTENTTRSAIFLAQLAKGLPEGSWLKSPQRIDHMAKVFFGSAARPLMTGFGLIGTGDLDINYERGFADMPIISRGFRRGGQLSYSNNVKKVYDRFSDINKGYYSGEYTKESRENQAKLLLGDATRALSMLGGARLLLERKEDRYKVGKEMNDLALEALKAADEILRPGAEVQSLRERFRNLKKEADQREKALENQFR